MTPFTWNEENIAIVKARYLSGHTATVIMHEIGAPSRNSVIGKIDRLGLRRDRSMPVFRAQRRSSRHFAISAYDMVQKLERRARRAMRKEMPPEPPVPPREMPIAPECPPMGERCQLMDLTSKTCRWPIGQVGHEDFFFCGAVPEEDSPYCPYHNVVAHK